MSAEEGIHCYRLGWEVWLEDSSLILQAQSNPLPLVKSNKLHHVPLHRAGGELGQAGDSFSEGPLLHCPSGLAGNRKKRHDKSAEAFPPRSQLWLQVAAALTSLGTEAPAFLGDTHPHTPPTANAGRFNSKSMQQRNAQGKGSFRVLWHNVLQALLCS